MSIRLGSQLLAGASSNDNLSITKNSSNKLQTIGIIDQNDTTKSIKTWVGTRAEYEELVANDEIDYNTVYNITDDKNITQALLETIYPVGSIYIGTMSICPLSSLFGTWTNVGTKLLTDVTGSNSVPVKGDGKALGLSNGTYTGTLVSSDSAGNNPKFATNTYGKNIGTTGTIVGVTPDISAYGVTTDATKSGIVADISSSLTKTNLVVNIWKRIE